MAKSKLIWVNKKYRGQKCEGQYKVFRSKRVFILSDSTKKKATI